MCRINPRAERLDNTPLAQSRAASTPDKRRRRRESENAAGSHGRARRRHDPRERGWRREEEGRNSRPAPRKLVSFVKFLERKVPRLASRHLSRAPGSARGGGQIGRIEICRGLFRSLRRGITTPVPCISPPYSSIRRSTCTYITPPNCLNHLPKRLSPGKRSSRRLWR